MRSRCSRQAVRSRVRRSRSTTASSSTSIRSTAACSTSSSREQSRSVVFSAEPAAVGGRRRCRRSASAIRHVCPRGIWHIWLGFDHILFLRVAAAARRAGAARRLRGEPARIGFVRRSSTSPRSSPRSRSRIRSRCRSRRSGIVSLPVAVGRIGDRALGRARRAQQPVPGGGERALDRGVRFRPVARFRVRRRAAAISACRPARCALSLAGFNIGVELGPAGDRRRFSSRSPSPCAARGPIAGVILAGGSAAIAAVAGVWLVERAFDVPLFAMLDGSDAGPSASRFVFST